MSLLGSVIQMVISEERKSDAEEELANLPEYQDYNPVSEMLQMQQRLERLSNNPYSSSSTSAFNAGLAESSNAATQRGVRADPSMSGAILSGMNNAGMQQRANREMQGDQLRANYLGQLGGVVNQIQGMDTANTGRFNQNLLMREQAIGNAIASHQQASDDARVHFGDESERKVGAIITSIAGGGMGGGGNFDKKTYQTKSSDQTPQYMSGYDAGYENSPGFTGPPQQTQDKWGGWGDTWSQ